MEMCFRISLMFLLMTADVDGQQGWGVNYSPSYVCALRGSTVKITCTIKYPYGHVVNKVFWTNTPYGEPPDLCLDPENRRGVQCHSENKDTYSITLTDVTEADKHIYYCRFITDQEGGKYTGVPGVQLDVTDLQVETNQRVKEGDSVTLTCKTTCSLTEETTFIWYRNTQIFTKGIKTLNQLHLQSVSRDDSGVYRCDAVRGSERLLSSSLYLNVEYPPEKTSVSISRSGEIMEGDSVTLTCSSESNPPVQIYSWFKGEKLIRYGQIYSITSIRSDQSGKYKCKSRNKHGEEDSDAVMLNVMYAPRNVVASISGSGEIMEGDSVNLTCSSESNPPVQEYTWFKGEIIRSGQIYSITSIRSDHSGEYKCKSRNKHGEKDSDAVMLNVMYAPRNVVASISGSGEIMEGDSVNLTCSSESNPPVQIYSWFKVNETSSVGSGQTYSITNFNSSHSGWFYCEAQNEVGSQRSDAVSVTVTGVHGFALYTLYGILAGCGALIFIIIFIILFMLKCRRDRTAEDIKQKQTADLSDDTYTALNPESRTSDDIYNTIRSDQCRAADGVYTTLELQSRSSEYDTLTVNRH
nr:B-cell receptor CD22-like [Misgurnus anguillicaudatus]